MKRRFFVIVSLSAILAVLFGGCMPKVQPFAPAKVKVNKALLYIYRPESFLARGEGWSVKVNGKIVRKYFINSSYITTYVEPGQTRIAIIQYGYPHGTYDKISLATKAGKTYYIKGVPGAFDSHKLKVMDEKVGFQEVQATQFYEDVK